APFGEEVGVIALSPFGDPVGVSGAAPPPADVMDGRAERSARGHATPPHAQVVIHVFVVRGPKCLVIVAHRLSELEALSEESPALSFDEWEFTESFNELAKRMMPEHDVVVRDDDGIGRCAVDHEVPGGGHTKVLWRLYEFE